MARQGQFAILNSAYTGSLLGWRSPRSCARVPVPAYYRRMTDSRFTDSNGNVIAKANFPTTAVTEATPMVTVNEDVFEEFRQPGDNSLTGKRLRFHAGQVIPAAAVDGLYVTAIITGVEPAGGPAAGGTVVTITGSGLRGATSVTFGGTAGTDFTVVSDSGVSVTTPAKAAGAVDVVVADDSGDTLLAGGFTYA